MNEELLFSYLQQHGPFAEWVTQYPLLADRVDSYVTVNEGGLLVYVSYIT